MRQRIKNDLIMTVWAMVLVLMVNQGTRLATRIEKSFTASGRVARRLALRAELRASARRVRVLFMASFPYLSISSATSRGRGRRIWMRPPANSIAEVGSMTTSTDASSGFTESETKPPVLRTGWVR